MTRFEERGVERQLSAQTVHEANREFRHSCKCCAERGFHLECDSCSIETVHKCMVSALRGEGLRFIEPLPVM